MSWFLYIVTATVLYGFLNYTYKLAASYGCPNHLVVNRAALTVSVLSLTALLITRSPFRNPWLILLFALINSGFFCLGSLSKIQALKRAPAAIAFPVGKLNAVFVILLSILLFEDRLTILQWAGVALSLIMLLVASIDAGKTKSNGPKDNVYAGISWALVAAAATAVSMLTGKFASTRVPLINYIWMSYTLVAAYTFLIMKTTAGGYDLQAEKKAGRYGMIAGTLNLIGYYLVLKAFASGPMALIQGVFSTSFIIPIILSVLLLKDRFDLCKAVIIILTLFSLLLIKLG